MDMLVSGRYLIMLMGIFAVYAGFIYNDTFGLMADLFGSAYDPPIKGESRSRRAPGAVALRATLPELRELYDPSRGLVRLRLLAHEMLF